jgi:hypothetical protein
MHPDMFAVLTLIAWSYMVAGTYTPDLGRTPMAAQDPMLSNIAQSTGYEQQQGDKQLEPAQKKNWFGF